MRHALKAIFAAWMIAVLSLTGCHTTGKMVGEGAEEVEEGAEQFEEGYEKGKTR
jgi:predicted RNase H-like HicB family nuclease